MTKDNAFSSLIAQGEGQKVEFKEGFGEEALETISAFANADGGSIFVGISDNAEVRGIQVGKRTLEDWANQIATAIDPRIKVDIEQLSLIVTGNKRIVEIKVPQSQSSAVSCKGRFLRRVGRTNQRMSGEDIAQKLMAVTKLSWDSGFEDKTSLSDIDTEAFAMFISLLNANGRRTVPKGTSIEELLSKLGLFENGKLARAAVLLLGSNPQKFYPPAVLKLGKFRTKTQIEDEREIRGCLLKQMSEGMTWFQDRLQTKMEITSRSERTTHWEYPLEAVREALANAICHRDYRLDGNVQIRLYDSYLEFWNPGSLPPSLSVEDLLQDHESVQRNTRVSECFYNAGFIEKWGTGTLRMDEFLRKNGHPRPEFESESHRFRLRFRRTHTAEYLMEQGLNERQVQLLLAVNAETKITNQFYTSRFEITKRTASRELSELLEKGFLTKHGSTGKGTFYVKS